MLTEIYLKNLSFFAFHGLYPEEKKDGNRFMVDVKIRLQVPPDPENEDLSVTVDYARVYSLIQAEMERPCALLESLCQRIILRITNFFPEIQELEVSVAKANPAIGGLCEWVKVSQTWQKS
jgi:dihydroneopterin aldolase